MGKVAHQGRASTHQGRASKGQERAQPLVWQLAKEMGNFHGKMAAGLDGGSQEIQVATWIREMLEHVEKGYDIKAIFQGRQNLLDSALTHVETLGIGQS